MNRMLTVKVYRAHLTLRRISNGNCHTARKKLTTHWCFICLICFRKLQMALMVTWKSNWRSGKLRMDLIKKLFLRSWLMNVMIIKSKECLFGRFWHLSKRSTCFCIRELRLRHKSWLSLSWKNSVYNVAKINPSRWTSTWRDHWISRYLRSILILLDCRQFIILLITVWRDWILCVRKIRSI